MIRRSALIAGVTLLVLGILAVIWDYRRAATSSSTGACGRFALHLASNEPHEGYRAAAAKIHGGTIYVSATAALTSADVSKAKLQFDPQGRPEVGIDFTAPGKRRLAELTRQHVHERLAIVVDDQVLLAPRIESEITQGSLLLTGEFTQQELEQLAQAISPGS
jgi:preprotein translocase subunit SecD